MGVRKETIPKSSGSTDLDYGMQLTWAMFPVFILEIDGYGLQNDEINAMKWIEKQVLLDLIQLQSIVTGVTSHS